MDLNIDATHVPSQEEIVATLLELGANGREFQFREVRKQLQIGAKGVAARRLYAVFSGFRASLIVTERPDTRTRHRYFSIPDANRLMEAATIVTNSTRKPGFHSRRPKPGRLTSLEGEIQSLNQSMRLLLRRVDRVATDLERFLSTWS